MPAIKFPTSPRIDLTHVDLHKVAERLNRERAVQVAKDVVYTSVGFGILAFQKAQVRRQEFVTEVRERAPRVLDEAVEQAEALVSRVARFIDERRGTGDAAKDAAHTN
jgi:hypothetical protein